MTDRRGTPPPVPGGTLAAGDALPRTGTPQAWNGARVSHYELIDRFATGGVAEIYRARDVRTGQLFVIKRMRADADFDPEHQAGFLRELQLALRCQHKNLIRGFEKGSLGGLDYVVLEYVDGQDLQAILQRAQRVRVEIPPAFASYVVAEILDGLDYASRITDAKGALMGLVHRDLAPKNIFVRYDGEIRIGDFGSSLATQTERATDIVGSLGYLSPEQARGESLDSRTDIFAAGLILYELLVGQPAFDLSSKDDAKLLKLHRRGVLRPVPDAVPADLKLIIEIATAPDVDDRYQSAIDMRRGLDRSDHPPTQASALGIATLLRQLFAAEFKASRMPGTPLGF